MKPIAPRGARVIYHDGSEDPLELAYRGRDERGLHVWAATTQLREMPQALRCEFLPERTVIECVGPIEGID